MLCELLARSGVAGRPNSYFREEDIAYWAARWDLAAVDTTSKAFDRAYLDAMERAGRADTAVFGVRLMWPSLATARNRLNNARGGESDFRQAFEARFGESAYIHLWREDILAQAVLLVRAQQSGLWHLNRDGSVMEGTDAPAPIVYDRKALGRTVADLRGQQAAWTRFFEDEGIAPLRLEYGAMTSDPGRALRAVLSALGRDPTPADDAIVPTAKMADATSVEWIARFRRGE